MVFRIPTVVRFITILLVSFTLPFIIPLAKTVGDSSNSLIHIMLIFSLLISFLINRALDRKITINSSVSIELSRLRRIHHLTENVKNTHWKHELYKRLESYQEAMSHGVFHQEHTSPAFREMTHHVYGFTPKNGREEHLFDDLLASTREIANERQRRESAFGSKMAHYSWLVMATYSIIIILLLLNSRDVIGFSEVSVGATITGVILVMDLLYRLNHFSKSEIDHLQKLYRENKAT